MKWDVDGKSVWWPATVTSISNSGSSRNAILFYHKYAKYEATDAAVLFTTSSTKQRFVRSVDGGDHNESDTSSWVYSDECLTDEANSSDRRAMRPTKQRSSLLTTVHNATGQKAHSNYRRSTKAAKSSSHNEVGNRVCGASSKPVKSEEEAASEQQKEDLSLRIQLLERRVQDLSSKGSAVISSNTLSVIVSLRWALLRSLDKPLRPAMQPSLDQYGVAPQELSVTAQCDYQTFREIAAVLAKEHKCLSINSSNSRVAFSPTFQTTQSGSSASDNMNILFSSLADITTFLRIRDDSDYDKILSKEVISESKNILRILGTYVIKDVDDKCEDSDLHPSGASTSTSSVSALSESRRFLWLFVGSAPVNFREVMARKGGLSHPDDDTEEERFTSTLFQQECRHFCTTQKCFRMPWTTKNIESRMSVNCSFDLDGTVDKEQLKQHFVLNWSRQAAPSGVKWTRDVQDVGNNAPGCLRLTIPAIMVTSNKNVRSLVSILDNRIETFMNVRSRMHNVSSFK